MTFLDLAAVSHVLGLDPDEVLAATRPTGDVRQRSSRATSKLTRRVIGRRLAAARQRRQLDPVALWRRTGITPYRLWVIEQGRDPTLAELQRLLPELGLTLAGLLEGLALTAGKNCQERRVKAILPPP